MSLTTGAAPSFELFFGPQRNRAERHFRHPTREEQKCSCKKFNGSQLPGSCVLAAPRLRLWNLWQSWRRNPLNYLTGG